MPILLLLSCGTFGSSQVSVDQIPPRIAYNADEEKSATSPDPYLDFVRPTLASSQPGEFHTRRPTRRRTFPDAETTSRLLSRSLSLKSLLRRHTFGSQPPMAPILTESVTISGQVRHKYMELKWLPRNFGKDLLGICDMDTLVKEIKSKTRDFADRETQDLKDFIRNKAPQLSVMLLYFKDIGLIEQFYRHGITDSHFPLDSRQADDNPDQMHVTHPRATLDIDERSSHVLFYAPHPSQNEFFVPVLEWKGFNDTPLTGQLPFLIKPTAISTTDFSIVRKSTIHRHHVDMKVNGLKTEVDEDNNPLVAIKELLQTTMTLTQFETLTRYEYNCLNKLRTSEFDTPHLIKAAAFYRKDDSLFFVFPWAKHGNLLNFWKQKSPEIHDQRYVRWLFGQFLGMAQTVESLHNPNVNIRHGDLKPENILCFESSDSNAEGKDTPYVFVISDVGLAKEHERLTQFRSRTKQPGGGTMVYAAPEMEMHENRATSRRYDIWSLGCIYLEFIIWLLYKFEGLQEFSKQRNGKFYRIQDNTDALRPGGIVKTAELNPAVSHWISHAIKSSRTAPNEDSAISRLLSLIADRLLVIDANPDYTDLKSADNDEAISLSPISSSPPSQFVDQPTIRVRRASTDLGRRMSTERAYAGEMYDEISEIIRQAQTGQIKWINHGDSTLQIPDLPPSPSRPALRGNEVSTDYDHSAERSVSDA
ncbi:hypothetical protein PFICI_12592 [Pestalotiopsis fici W106-1]|uniref:Protein kinase domain-containing protein n=1 Tax=Pestalotiopsis fici (strain W106-1 / CGMCC3.15140) TaxID=1229662 RepID=W3WP59_PESFW|nr:uncharacterized protein PFICI_12592 [Pestalotiopsis fici W106-1]ETS75648.1 hypothetical protein PFICI_12592 [Pestalotiopsis fici W106-1]